MQKDGDGSNRRNSCNDAATNIKESNSWNYVDWVAKPVPSCPLARLPCPALPRHAHARPAAAHVCAWHTYVLFSASKYR
jgi:3-methyladenine DNA glycosylase AlkD